MTQMRSPWRMGSVSPSSITFPRWALRSHSLVEALDLLDFTVEQTTSCDGEPGEEGPVVRLTANADILGGHGTTEAADSLTRFAGELIERGVPFDFDWVVDDKNVVGHHRFGRDGVSRHLMGGSVPALVLPEPVRGEHFSVLPSMQQQRHAEGLLASHPTPTQPHSENRWPQSAGAFFARTMRSQQQPVGLSFRAKGVAAAVLCADPRVSLADLSAVVDDIPLLAGDEAAYVLVASTRRHRARQNIERLSELGLCLTSTDVECALQWLYEFPPPQSCLFVVRELCERLAAHEAAMHAMRLGPGWRRESPDVAASPLATPVRTHSNAQTRRR